MQSIYWKPAEGVARERLASAYEFFFLQQALEEILEHVWSVLAGSAPFGYLIGDLCEAPDAGLRYVVVSGSAQSRIPFQEDSAPQISVEADAALQLDVGRRRGTLVGWYHAHPSGSVTLSDADITTHLRSFGHPWMCALVAVTDATAPSGGVFYATGGGFSGDQCLPLYEVVDRDGFRPRGMLRTRLDWGNLVTDQSVVREPRPRPAPPPTAAPEGAPRIGSEAAPASLSGGIAESEVPDVEKAGEVPEPSPEEVAFVTGVDRFDLPNQMPEMEAGLTEVTPAPGQEQASAPAAARTSGLPGRLMRMNRKEGMPLWLRQMAVVAGSLATVVVIGFSLVMVVRWAKPGEPALGSGSDSDSGGVEAAAPSADVSPTHRGAREAGQPATPEGGAVDARPPSETPAAALQRFDGLSDALLSEISRYYGVVVAVDAARASCVELRRSYVQVEDAWMAYSVRGKAPLTTRLGPTRAARDARLYAGVQDAERLFGESGCERP